MGAVFTVRKKSEKTTLIEHEGVSAQHTSELKEQQASPSLSQASLPPLKKGAEKTLQKENKEAIMHKKLKKQQTAAITPMTGLSEAEKKEVEKTESEMDVEEQKVICIVHKGPILGTSYICPHCQTFYCLKCASTLKQKDERCWVCDKAFSL